MAVRRGLVLGLDGGGIIGVLVHAVIVAVVSALDMAVQRDRILGLGLGGVIGVLVHAVVVVVHDELAVEVVDVAEVSSSAARVELPRPERDLVVRVERVRWIFSQVGRQDGSVAHLVTALSAIAWHGRDRHAPGVEVLASSRQARIQL
jgi:hypothetical protein